MKDKLTTLSISQKKLSATVNGMKASIKTIIKTLNSFDPASITDRLDAMHLRMNDLKNIVDTDSIKEAAALVFDTNSELMVNRAEMKKEKYVTKKHAITYSIIISFLISILVVLVVSYGQEK